MGKTSLARFLIDNGAKLRVHGSGYCLALCLARSGHHEPLVELLEEKVNSLRQAQVSACEVSGSASLMAAVARGSAEDALMLEPSGLQGLDALSNELHAEERA